MTEQQIFDKVEELKAAFADGFQLRDLATIVRAAIEFASLAQLPGPEKKALAIQVIERVIDETDTPWLPDALVDPLMKRFVPDLIDLVVDAVKGRVAT